MAGEVGERDHRAYAYGSVVLLDDPVEPGNAAKIYDAARLQQAFLHQVEKVDAAGLDDNGILRCSPAGRHDHGGGNSRGSRTRRFGFRLRVQPFETLHFQLPRGMRPSAASTAAGVIGNCRSRTPIAL